MLCISVPALAKDWHKNPDRIYELASREKDPLPIRYLPGDRYGTILVSEFETWLMRNTVLFNEKA